MALAILPDQMSVGAGIEWDDQKTTITYYNGQEQHNLDWPFPKAALTFNTPQLDNAIYKTFLDLYETHGRAIPFEVKVHSRYSITDEAMGGTVGGGNKDFIIQEAIAVGNETITRFIDYPDDATLVVEDNGSPVSIDSRVKRTVTLDVAPTVGPMTATTEFRRLMRFRDRIRASVGPDEDSGSLGPVRLLEMFEFT